MTTAQTNDYLAKTRRRVGLAPRPLAASAWWRVPAESVFDGPMPLESERELYRRLDGACHGEWGGYLLMAPVTFVLVVALLLTRRRGVIA